MSWNHSLTDCYVFRCFLFYLENNLLFENFLFIYLQAPLFHINVRLAQLSQKLK